MDSILIPCPECGRELRLRNRSLLGRMGRCPECRHRFVLEETEESDIELELVDAAPRASTTEAGPSMRRSPEADPDAIPVARPVGKKPVPREQPHPLASASLPSETSPVSSSSPSSGRRRLSKEQRAQAARRKKLGLMASGISAVLLAGIYFVWRAYSPNVVVIEEGKQQFEVDPAWRESKEALRENLALAATQDPTHGEPIRLLYIPSGAHIIFNLHPRAMWEAGSARQEMLAGLGPLVPWLEQRIRDICLFEPADIEEALICVHLGTKGMPPEYSTVVHLAGEPKKSDLVLKFQAERTEEFGPTVYVGPERAFMLRDDGRTVCVSPADRVQEMADAVVFPNPTNPSISGLLSKTDRERHFTVVCQPRDLLVHRESLFLDSMLPALDQLLLWLGNDVETLAWSLHQGPRKLHSEVLIQPATVSSPARLHNELRRKLDGLSTDILWTVERMRPTLAGPRRIIGRYPAMLEAYALQTIGGIGDDYVQFTTVLPERAGPNLSVGTTFVWDESTRTDFSQEFAPTQPTGPKLPETVAERMQLPVDLDFERTPLYQAFDYIGEEIQVKFEIDGDALKAAGMTKNMEQAQSFGEAPAIRGIQAILDRYTKEGMCIVVDEAAKTATVTTQAAAKAKGQTPTLGGK